MSAQSSVLNLTIPHTPWQASGVAARSPCSAAAYATVAALAGLVTRSLL
ncbi:MAG TPA: hypothetical protein VKB48_16540 [Candidatus Acidoferrum sp.]|nr:hypothetical protein [Candidatus Acidoferrum sp.]